MQRTIKKYGNRKLYDTLASRYVTLNDVALLIDQGEDVCIIDNETGADITLVTLAQLAVAQQKKAFVTNPLQKWYAISDWASKNLETWQIRLDERIQQALSAMINKEGTLRDQVALLEKRVKALEQVIQKNILK